MSGNGLGANGAGANGAGANGAGANGIALDSALVPAVCPVGFFADKAGSSCTSLGPSEPQCLDGFAFDAATKTCRAQKADGNYPGCPAGQLLDPSTGACDFETQIVSATELIHTQAFQVNLPDCSTAKKNGGDGSNGNSGSGTIVCLKNCP